MMKDVISKIKEYEYKDFIITIGTNDYFTIFSESNNLGYDFGNKNIKDKIMNMNDDDLFSDIPVYILKKAIKFFEGVYKYD